MGLSSDHVKHACDEQYKHASVYCITDDLSVSPMLPIRNGKSFNYAETANYRGIASNSLFGKIFDANVLIRYDTLLAASNLQFGFQAGFSTSLYSMNLKETLECYCRIGSPAYFTMLDATKAFDRVEFCI